MNLDLKLSIFGPAECGCPVADVREGNVNGRHGYRSRNDQRLENTIWPLDRSLYRRKSEGTYSPRPVARPQLSLSRFGGIERHVKLKTHPRGETR